MNIRIFLFAALGATLPGAFQLPASAQEAYPSKPIRLIVPWPAGGVVDIAARLIEPDLRDQLKQAVVIANLGGAAGTLGTEQAVRSRADGYTLILFSSHTSNVGLVRTLPYEWTRDLAPLAPVATATNLLVTHPALSVKSVTELIALARKRPNDITAASSGEGSAAHLALELFKALGSVKMLHVPYKGAAPAINDLLGGHVSVFFPPLPVGLPHAQTGKVIILGVTGAKRSAQLPDVPAISETLRGYEADQWLGIFGPVGLPEDVAQKINHATNAALSVPRLREGFATRGLGVFSGSIADLRETALADKARMEKALKTVEAFEKKR